MTGRKWDTGSSHDLTEAVAALAQVQNNESHALPLQTTKPDLVDVESHEATAAAQRRFCDAPHPPSTVTPKAATAQSSMSNPSTVKMTSQSKTVPAIFSI